MFVQYYNFIITGSVPPADTDTLPSSEDEDYAHASSGLSPNSPGSIGDRRIFVKKASGGFVGLTPNQLQHLQMIDLQQQQNNLRLSQQQQAQMLKNSSKNHRSNL